MSSRCRSDLFDRRAGPNSNLNLLGAQHVGDSMSSWACSGWTESSMPPQSVVDRQRVRTGWHPGR